MPTSARSRLVAQFHRPSGALGRVAGWIMSRRGSNKKRNLWTVSLLEIGLNDRVLEIGFGPGLAIQEAARMATAGKVVGVDHSDVMWRLASNRNRKAIDDQRVELHCAPVTKLPDLGGPFDAIFSVNCMMFWEEPARVCSQLVEMLVPGGTLAITHQPRKPGAGEQDLARSATEISGVLEDAGLEEIRIERLSLAPVDALCVLGRRPDAATSVTEQSEV
jgi:SAM-dependent methyltransferase